MLILYKGHLFISLIKVEIMHPAWNKNDANAVCWEYNFSPRCREKTAARESRGSDRHDQQ